MGLLMGTPLPVASPSAAPPAASPTQSPAGVTYLSNIYALHAVDAPELLPL